MRTQEFLGSHVPLVFTLWGLWTCKLLQELIQPEQDVIFPPPNISVYHHYVKRLNQKSLMKKCYLK